MKKTEVDSVPCPICKKPVAWSEQSPYRPFCSKRCQLIDLGEWANEEKAISAGSADFAEDARINDASDWTH